MKNENMINIKVDLIAMETFRHGIAGGKQLVVVTERAMVHCGLDFTWKGSAGMINVRRPAKKQQVLW